MPQYVLLMPWVDDDCVVSTVAGRDGDDRSTGTDAQFSPLGVTITNGILFIATSSQIWRYSPTDGK